MADTHNSHTNPMPDGAAIEGAELGAPNGHDISEEHNRIPTRRPTSLANEEPKIPCDPLHPDASATAPTMEQVIHAIARDGAAQQGAIHVSTSVNPNASQEDLRMVSAMMAAAYSTPGYFDPV
tara:strand:+ start:164 stop:532 length:369 start_codon:yes stop_codon:yes gene_type:complete